MRRHIGLTALRAIAQELRTVIGTRFAETQLLADLDRFANRYGLNLEAARRAVMVLHGIPPGLAGPSDQRFTWQQELDAFDVNIMRC
jgi:hypothetical protein